MSLVLNDVHNRPVAPDVPLEYLESDIVQRGIEERLFWDYKNYKPSEVIIEYSKKNPIQFEKRSTPVIISNNFYQGKPSGYWAKLNQLEKEKWIQKGINGNVELNIPVNNKINLKQNNNEKQLPFFFQGQENVKQQEINNPMNLMNNPFFKNLNQNNPNQNNPNQNNPNNQGFGLGNFMIGNQNKNSLNNQGFGNPGNNQGFGNPGNNQGFGLGNFMIGNQNKNTSNNKGVGNAINNQGFGFGNPIMNKQPLNNLNQINSNQNNQGLGSLNGNPVGIR